MLQSSIRQLRERYGEQLTINLMSVYPKEDRVQVPWDFVKVIPAKPEQLLIAFPMAILYRLFSWCLPVRALLLKHPVLKAYSVTDAVLDEAGVSFVDSRGFVMNSYAFVCAAVPMLMGVPVMKYSQALGEFRNPWNRFLAKWILPKMKLICARGKITESLLSGIGITENVKLCADGAFSMEDDPVAEQRVAERTKADSDFFNDRVVGLSLSSVVEKKCAKQGTDYRRIVTEFTDSLTKEGYHVLVLANAARIGSTKTRNNDLMICDAVYGAVADKEKVRWYHEEMTAEEIRSYISRCRYLVASRFHAMVGALEKKVPVTLVGWSHKYQEVLDFFELGDYAEDFSSLSAGGLLESFHRMVSEEENIRGKLEKNHESTVNSSRENIMHASRVVDRELKRPRRRELLEYRLPERYAGSYLMLRKGYAADASIRENAASGGMVTGLLCWLLKTGRIDGAWVTRSEIRNGKVTYRTFIAVNEEEIRSASSSVYMTVPMLKHLNQLREFPGKVAVVMLPCMLKSFSAILDKEPDLRDKTVLKIGLFCSGNHAPAATELALKKAGINLEGAERFFFRRGHWRGNSAVIYKDGTEKTFSYTKLLCAYKNAFFFEQGSCMTCQDHFAKSSDLSFGDLWIGEMKKNPIKHSCVVIRTEKGREWYQAAVRERALMDSHLSGRDLIRGQKRALVFKYPCAKAKKSLLSSPGAAAVLDIEDHCAWNHRLAALLAVRNKAFSEKHPDTLARIPSGLVYGYMCFIRGLLNF